MRTRVSFIALLACLVLPAGMALAHEGHIHKVMGTVAAVHADTSQMQIKANDGSTADLVINDRTRYLRGERPTTVQDLKPGVRVVAMYQEEAGKKIATEVRLAENKAHDPATQEARPAPPAPKKPNG